MEKIIKIKRAPKANYKIYNISRNCYETINRKTTWSSKTWVVIAVEGILRRRTGGAPNFEIHVFPIESAIRVPFLDLQKEVKEEEAARLDKTKAAKEARELEQERQILAYDIERKSQELESMKRRQAEVLSKIVKN